MERLYDVKDDTSGRLTVEVLRQSEDGEKVRETVDPPFDPYCYIRSEDLDMAECRRLDVRVGGDAPEGFMRIEADDPWDLREYDDSTAHQTFEADVRFPTRMCIDEDWGFAMPESSDICYFDIEVDDRGDFAEPGDAPDRIISIAAVGADGRTGYWDSNNEEGLVQSFLEWADTYMVLVGWNSLGYDFEYLDNRCLTLGMDVDWNRWVKLDMMPLYDMLARPTETLSLNLSDTAERETEEGLHDDAVSPGGGDLWDAWQESPEDLERYNMRDTTVLKQIDEKYGIVKLLFTICDICGTPPEDTCYVDRYGEVKFAPGSTVDAHILSVAHDRGVPMPNRGRYETHDFPGADVLDPEPGFYDNMATLDYSGMYPNIVRAFNFGPTTWYEDEEAAYAEEGNDVELIDAVSGMFVSADERRSIMAEAVDELVEFREGAAAIVDRGVKVINNTLYGVTASPFHRYYLPGMSENITLTGQRLVRLAEEGAQRCDAVLGVRYGDTDSVMVELDAEPSADPRHLVELAADAVEVTEGVLREWAEERGADGSYLQLDIDDVYRKFYLGDKKKRYFGHRLWSGGWSNEVKITGLEYVQGDVPKPARDMQYDLIHVKLGHDDRSVSDVVDEYKTLLRSGDIDSNMATLKGLGKPIKEYDHSGTPPLHVRAAMAIREEYGQEAIGVGSKVGYIKFGSATKDWTWVHDGEMGRQLLQHHYDYLWSEKFEGVMESIDVQEYNQTSLGAFG